jgi:hypothetical protein
MKPKLTISQYDVFINGKCIGTIDFKCFRKKGERWYVECYGKYMEKHRFSSKTKALQSLMDAINQKGNEIDYSSMPIDIS